ncbi:MAG: class I SAM-dependent methyltransferase [Burkholderiaceae bacterium]|nr:class I SAM-dependent methyltransferase [Burkholderiaceae bacterium]
MADAATQTLAYYAARAPHYDAVYTKPERRRDITHLATWLPTCFRGRTVLEVACGTGFWTQFIAPATASMVATDLTAEPLALARARSNVANVRFERVDANALPAQLGEFDGAFAGLWFSHVPIERRRAFLDGLHARLRHGARVVMIDNSAVQCRELPITETDARGNTYQQRRLPDGSVHRVLKNFPTQAELLALVAPCATDVQYRDLDNFWLLEYTLAGPVSGAPA